MKKSKVLAPVLVTTLLLGTSLVTSGVQAAQEDSLLGFQAKSNGKLKVAYDQGGAPLFVSGTLSDRVSTGGPGATSLEFLEQHKAFFQMKSPRADLKVLKQEKDDLGMTHVRLQQTKNGVPIEHAVVLVHVDRNGAVTGVNGDFDQAVDALELDTTATVPAEEALNTAKGAVNAPDVIDYAPSTETVVYPYEGKHYLAHKVNLNFLGEKPGNWFVYVDAKTGAVIDQYNSLMDLDLKPAHASGTGVKGDHRVLKVSHDNTASEGSTFYLKSVDNPQMGGLETYDFKNQWRSSTVRLPGDLFADKDASWTDDYQRAAVDAHYNSELVYDYFLDQHGRNSIDGNGMAIVSSVHYGVDYNNAFWNGVQMTYGDGDGKFFIPLSAGLDVAAHEMTHGVTTHSAGLIYRFESGALNESYSDIFGALVDGDDWEMGEDIMAPEAVDGGRTALRSLSNPSKFPVNAAYTPYGDGSGMYPKNMSQFYKLPLSLDSGGVHVNSSIWNHAAYLVGTKIGKEKLGKIYYRALTVYLTPTSNFKQARIATIQSAADLYGADSPEVKAVTDSLNEVGITE